MLGLHERPLAYRWIIYQNKSIYIKRTLGSLIAHMSPGIWVTDVLECGKGDMIPFKDISIFSSGSHVVQPSWAFWSVFGRGQLEDHFCEIIVILDQWFRIFHLKISLIYSSANPFLRWENHLYNFGRGHHEEHFFETILNLNRWFRWKCY